MRRLSLTVLLAFLVSVTAESPMVMAVGTNDPLKAQSELDTVAASPSDGSGQGTWADMTDGASDRPFITHLSYQNGESDPVYLTPVGGTSDPGWFTTHQTSTGDITAIVSPYNLCKTGVTPAAGVCYATPNRVSIGLGFFSGGEAHRDFARPAAGQSSEIDENTVFDMTISLNTLGAALRWSQLNGDVLYWEPHNLGQADSTLRIKFTLADTPEFIGDYNVLRGCYTIPQDNCPQQHPTGTFLEANLVLSLEEGYGESLTGSVFSIQNAMSGEICDGTFTLGEAGSVAPYCQKTASPTNPVMEFQMAGVHYSDNADSIVTQGSMKAFIPAGALLNIYGIVPTDASTTFAVTRASAESNTVVTGANDAPTFTPWTAEENGADGLLVEVTGVTFSTPKYTITKTAKTLKVSAKQAGSSRTRFTTKKLTCTKSAKCVISVYRISSARYDGSLGDPIYSHTFKAKNPTFSISKSKIRKNQRYLVVVRSPSGTLKKSTVGTVVRP